MALTRILLGPAYVELHGLARQELGADLGWQFTAVWSVPIPKTPLEFLGYLDWNTRAGGDHPSMVMTEPQLLARFGKWAVGSELEISRNFPGAFTEEHGFAYKTWYSHPTVFLRVDL